MLSHRFGYHLVYNRYKWNRSMQTNLSTIKNINECIRFLEWVIKINWWPWVPAFLMIYKQIFGKSFQSSGFPDSVQNENYRGCCACDRFGWSFSPGRSNYYYHV